MGGRMIPVRSLCPGKNFLKIRTRVTWEVCPVNNPLSPYALHIVLIDAEVYSCSEYYCFDFEGNKIEAIARKPLMSKFKSELYEGKVYNIYVIELVTNISSEKKYPKAGKLKLLMMMTYVRVITLEDEYFLKLYPRKDIRELNDTVEDGIFIVMANISGLVEGEKWWYYVCSCHKVVTVEDGLSYCGDCSKLEFDDGLGCGVFVVFDTYCQQLLIKTCKELIMASKAAKDYPNEIKSIIGRHILFKV
ncbi:uncharacterized protein LOC130712498 [Lotus japonicus]|uniref:uncharacterized protein LOC130712498 n=1 Tax=Lotus japonicus TaxID=34305 RepID=UPI002583D8A8|nr:uncharacterized protein LOC130712498 [Lotus japonicus]